MDIKDSDFRYVDDENDELNTNILIEAENAWHGVQFKYGRVSADVGDQEDLATLKFDLYVTNQEPDVAEEIENDPDFQDYVGRILTHIITSAFEREEYRIGGDDDTDDNSA